MMKEAKNEIRRLIESGYEELYLVTNYISNEAGCTNLWFIYDKLEDALTWIRKVHSTDSVFQKIEEQKYDLPEIMEEVGVGPEIWWRYTDRFGHHMKQQFLIQRVN